MGGGDWWFTDDCSEGSHLNGNRSYYGNDDPLAMFMSGSHVGGPVQLAGTAPFELTAN